MKLRSALFLFAIFAFIFAPQNALAADAWFIQGMNTDATLAPGDTSYCNKDFQVKNKGDEMAQVQVILGNGANYQVDNVEPNSTRSYSLSGDYPMAGVPEAKNAAREEARIINSTGGTAKIHVECR